MTSHLRNPQPANTTKNLVIDIDLTPTSKAVYKALTHSHLFSFAATMLKGTYQRKQAVFAYEHLSIHVSPNDEPLPTVFGCWRIR